MELVQIKEEREELEKAVKELQEKIAYLRLQNNRLLEKLARYENLMQKGHLK